MAFFAERTFRMSIAIADQQNYRRHGWWMAVGLFVLTFLVAWQANHYRLADILTHGSDPWGYYQFLPALLGTHEWVHLPWAHTLENGNSISLFTMGVAMLMLPFFLLGAAAAKLLGLPADGYSMPFVFAQFVAASFYVAAGCHLLFHALRRRFTVRVALVVPLALYGATNLFFYSTHEPGMSHVYSFFLFAWLHHLTVRMLEQPRADRLIGLFLCAALVVLVRQLNAVALLFPLLYGAPFIEALRTRVQWLRDRPLASVIGLVLALALVAPQLYYWHMVTGETLVFTYGKKGEGFTWAEPHLYDVLLSHQNGWFIYTPLMLFTMGVLVVQALRNVRDMRLVLFIWAVSWYVYASWWSWWLGGSFGHRGFIEHYALLAIPLAFGLEGLFRRGPVVRDLSMAALGLLVFFSIRLSFLYHWPWEGADWTWEKLIAVWERAFVG
jgi:hypothetical protein